MDDHEADTSARVAVRPLLDHVFGSARRALWLLMGAVGLVLVIACANVAGLLVARNALRARELAVRRALGETSWQLVRLNLVEAGVLAAAGGAVGMAIAGAALRGLMRSVRPRSCACQRRDWMPSFLPHAC